MSKAGAVGGITPAIPAGPQDGGAKAAVQTSDAKAAEGKPSAPPLAEASNRAPPDAAVELSAAFAGLKPGQELRGTVRLLPGQPHALLKTPQGDFRIEPAAGLEPDSRISVVLTRADRAISALLLSAGGKTLDVPRPVQLTLVSLAPQGQPAAKAEASPAPTVPTRADGALVQPAPAQPAPAPPAPSLTSLLPGEAIPLRGGSHLPQPLPGMPAPASAQAAVPSSGPSPAPHTHNPVPHRPGVATAPMPPVPLPSAPQPAAGLQSAPINGADPLDALFDRGVMPLTLQTGMPNAPQKTLSASLLATTAPGETSPLAQPPANSPLARLAESGRLVTATALPPQPNAQSQAQPQTQPQAQALPGAQAPAQPPAPGSTAPNLAAPGQTATPATPAASQNQPAQLAINGTAARLALPAGVPAPQPGTQLVFLVTAGHEALRTLPAAPVPPQSQSQSQSQAQTQAQPPQAQTHAAPSGPSPATVSPSSATPAAPANPTAPTPTAPTTDARPAMPAAPDVRAVATAAPAAARAPAPAGSASIPEPPMMAWVPGMPAPMTVQTTAPTTPASGEALLMAVMQALGRKGFAASPRDLSNAGADADGVEAGANAPLLARLLHAAATSATTAAARAEQAQEAPPAPVADALPFVMTLQTPQGQIPLVFLVWQPVRGDEESNSPGADGEADVCFAVEVEFESIGRLRLRGSVGPAHLNLGVETEQPLGAALQQAARKDFTEAVEAGGMTGTLVFRRRDAAS